MEIKKILEDGTLTILLIGRLDTNTAGTLENELKQCLDGVNTLFFDFKELEYLSSAGLRVIFSAQKRMKQQGSMTLKNVNETITEIFNITGFSDILNIES